MPIILAVVILAIVVAGAGLAVIYTGGYNVAATAPHSDPVRWVLKTTYRNSVSRQAADIAVPALDSQERIATGARHYDEMCAGCHGVPGKDTPEMAKHMRPQPPQLAEAATAWRPNEIFWIVKHGLKMTGMPAWGPTHSDDKLWSIVAFVDKLPELPRDKYASLVSDGGSGQRREAGHHEHSGGGHEKSSQPAAKHE